MKGGFDVGNMIGIYGGIRRPWLKRLFDWRGGKRPWQAWERGPKGYGVIEEISDNEITVNWCGEQIAFCANDVVEDANDHRT